MNPGATRRLVASTVRPACASERSPTWTIRSSRKPTSATKPSAPVPSSTVPPLIITSNSSKLVDRLHVQYGSEYPACNGNLNHGEHGGHGERQTTIEPRRARRTRRFFLVRLSWSLGALV